MNGTKKNINKQILSLFSGQQSIITIPKIYITLTGSHSLALVLNQCIFWSDKSSLKDGWFYKDYQEWFDETHIPERTLRRRFDKLEENGWIITKVKKVGSLNKKHIHPNIEKITDSISNLLNKDLPNRPHCPEKTYNEQKSCINIAPTGQTDRSRTANMADSYISTDEYLHMNTTKLISSSFFFSESTDKNLLAQKLERDNRTNEQFMNECVNHVDNNSSKEYPRLQRANALVKLLKNLNENNIIFRQKDDEKEAHKDNTNIKPLFTDEDIELMGRYKQAKRLGKDISLFINKAYLRDRAEELVKKESALKEYDKCDKRFQMKNAGVKSLSSLLNMGALQS